jgi:hypothetical protein
MKKPNPLDRSTASEKPIPTIDLALGQPGDIVLCHEQGFLAKAIRFGQRLRVPWVYSEWNHCAVLAAQSKGVVGWTVYEAEATGISEQPLSSVGEYVIVSADSFLVPGRSGGAAHVNRDRQMAYARSAVGAKYGFLTILCIIVNIFTPRLISFRRPGTLICSAFAMRSLEHGGAISPVDPFQIQPAEVAELAATGVIPSPIS